MEQWRRTRPADRHRQKGRCKTIIHGATPAAWTFGRGSSGAISSAAQLLADARLLAIAS